MMGNDRLIEEIVRSVLEQIEHHDDVARTQASGGRKPPVAPNNPVQTNLSQNHPVPINASVITGELLETRVNGSKGVLLTPSAILTPSARDVIRNRGIEVTRCEANPSVSSTKWKVITTCTTPALERVLNDATHRSADHESVDSDHDAAATAVSVLCRAEANGALVFTRRPHRIACLANRNQKVRAAVAADAADIKRVIAEVGANLLCVDPSDQPWFGLRNIFRQLPPAGAPRLPPDWPE